MLRQHSTLAHFTMLSIAVLLVFAGFCLLQADLDAAEVEAAVMDTAAAVETPAGPGAREKNWEPLLGDNYKELWRSYGKEDWPKGWQVEDGVLSRVGGGGDIMTKAKYADFVLKLEWKISEKGNSGIMYRVRTGDDAAYFSGPEYQVLDNKGHADGVHKSHTAASLYGLYAPEKDWTKPVGQWNKTRIVVKGNHVQHFLNGHKTVDCKLGSEEWNELVDNSKFKQWKQFGKSAEGHIVLQDHGDAVWYRNISIRRVEKKQ